MVHVSQRIADYIRRHRLSYILSARSDGVSRREYVFGRIVVAVMLCAAILACPFAVAESELIVFPATDMAEFRAGEKSINCNQLSSIPSAFVIEHLAESAKTDFRYCPAQATISDHVFHSEVFENDHVILSDQFYGQFIEKVFARIGDGFGTFSRRSGN